MGIRYLLIVLSVYLALTSSISASETPHRVIILTDIEADPDDTQSLIRLLLYSNEIDIKGIIATTSCWMKSEIHPESIHRIIDHYALVRPNLLLHEHEFPEASALSLLVKQGLPTYGMRGVGENKDSEGSNWIIQELEKDDKRPLWISVWGGVNTLAQALYTIRKTKSEEDQQKLISKLRVYTISDQDDSGIWIRNNFPDLFYVVTPGDDYGNATWTGINTYVQGIQNQTISNSWLSENIQQNHGPLGSVYPDVAWGMEGDTPAFLSLIQNGLSNPEHPHWGGWGGRYEFYTPDKPQNYNSAGSGVPLETETRAIWTNASDTFTPFLASEYGRNVTRDTLVFEDNRVSLWRWRDDFQHDFAARMDWTIYPYERANHAPEPLLSHPERLTVSSGENFTLNAFHSTDPDGDNISFLWFHYPEAGTYKKDIPINGAENIYKLNVTAPMVEREETAHFILRVTDKGEPSLSSYKRIIVTIVPN